VSRLLKPERRDSSPVWAGRPVIDDRNALLLSYRHRDTLLLYYYRSVVLREEKPDVLQGTLALLVLRTLHALGPLHGYGIARRIEQVSDNTLALNQGTLYPALLRLEQMGWLSSTWGLSENNRKAKYYAITRTGKNRLSVEEENWERVATIVGRFLKLSGSTP
jgi:PadR family transcriptional regulator PadR